jgi:GPH family glycoside/pentoside/hexuronide:cation symporter
MGKRVFLWRQRIGFGIAELACNIGYIMVNTYLLIYYTDVVGIPAGKTSVIFMATKVFDAVTDYLVGRWIDRTNTRMGRNRPWMLAGIPVLALGLILVFSTPEFPMAGKLIWACATYMLVTFGYTMINISMSSILPSLSADSRERDKIVTVKTLFASIGSMVAAALAGYLLKQLGGQGKALAYCRTSMVFAALVSAILVISVVSIREVHPPVKTVQKNSFWQDMKFLRKNRPFLLLLPYTFSWLLGYVGMFAAMSYYFTYIAGDGAMTGRVITAMTLGNMAGMVLSGRIIRYLSKRTTVMACSAFQALGFLCVWLGEGTGLVMAGLMLYAVGYGISQPLYWSISVDTMDYGEYLSKKSLAGTQTALIGFVSKIAGALASAGIAVILSLGGYDGSLAVQAPAALSAIRIAFIGIPILSCAGVFASMWFYQLDKESHEKIKLIVDQRREEAGLQI